MKLTVTPKVQQWFKDEVGVSKGDSIRFYGKVYGKTNIHEGFSVGMSVEQPTDIFVEETIDGIKYYVEETDNWFFEGHNLIIDYDAKEDEPTYTFVEQ